LVLLSGCEFFLGLNGVSEEGDVLCSDGDDNDGDGAPDCADESCAVACGLSCGDGVASPGEVCLQAVVLLPIPSLDASVGNFDGDNIADLLSVDSESDTLSLLSLNGSLPLSFPVPLAGANFFAFTGDWIDLDQDGKDEIALLSTRDDTLQTHIHALRVEGGSLTETGFSVGPFDVKGPRSFDVKDFNQDGRPDFVLISENLVELKLNENGVFRLVQNFGGQTPYDSVAFGDFNLDGVLELVIPGPNNATTVSVSSRLDAEGTYAGENEQQVLEAFADVSFVAIGDLDQNGKPDLAAASFDEFAVGFNEGQGPVFGASPLALKHQDLAQLLLGDIDNDGDLDAVYLDLPSGGASSVSMLRNQGAGVFVEELLVEESGLSRIRLVDLNGDGRLDLLSAGQNGVTAHVQAD
jgi:hypothetical protein